MTGHERRDALPASSDKYFVRPGRPDDVDAVVSLNESVHPYPGVGSWTRDLFERHPTVQAGDFVIAESRADRRVAAALVAIGQRWMVDGASVPAVQVELVGTDPRDRGHGLTGLLLDAVHRRCRSTETPLQLISGIPYFYRRFGYEYAVRSGDAIDIPAAAVDAASGPSDAELLIRPAVVSDALALADVDRAAALLHTVTSPRDERAWRYELTGRRPDSLPRVEVSVLTDRRGVVRGYLVTSPRIGSDGELKVFAATCVGDRMLPGPWLVMLRHLALIGATSARTSQRVFTSLRMFLPEGHELTRLAPHGSPRRTDDWYARSDDLRKLLQLRLSAQRRQAPWSMPTLLIDTYHEIIRLRFRDGRLYAVDATPRDPLGTAGDVTAPPAAVLQLVLGYASPQELLHRWPDMTVRNPAALEFLTAAFPKLSGCLWSAT